MSQLKLKYSTRQNPHHLSWSCADSKAVELCFYLVQIYVFYRAATESKNDFCLVFVSRSKTAAPQVTASSALTLVFSFFAFFSFLRCIFDCACASVQPVRSYQRGRLGRGGVTKLGSGPSRFSPGALLAERWHMCCDREAALWTIWGRLVVAVRVHGPGLCVSTSLPMLPEVDMPHIKDKQGHRVCLCTKKKRRKSPHIVRWQYNKSTLLLPSEPVHETKGDFFFKLIKKWEWNPPRLHMC